MALALAFAAALITTALGELTDTLRGALIYNRYFYTHQVAAGIVISVVGALLAPTLAMIFILPYARVTGRTLARMLVVVVILIALELAAGSIISHFETGSQAPDVFATQFNLYSLTPSAVTSCLLGMTLVFALSALTRRFAPASRTSRLADWLVAGAIIGVVVSVIGQMTRLLLLTLTAIELARVGAFDCQAGSGVNCYPYQLLGVALFTLAPSALGGAVGGAIGGALAASSVPSVAGVGAGERAGAMAPRRRSLLVVSLQYVAAGVIGALYALYTLLPPVAKNWLSQGASVTNGANWTSLLWTIILASLALVAPISLLALAGGGRRALRWPLLVVAVALALVVPASVVLQSGPILGTGPGPVILEALALGVIFGGAWAPPPRTTRARSAWAAGVLAATPAWVGGSLVYAALGVVILSQAGRAAASCHGLGCGALLMVVLVSVIGQCVEYILLGFPAALLAGGLAALLRAG